MSKSLKCSVKNRKILEASSATFVAKIFATHTCNITGKYFKVFVMTIFASTEVQIAWHLIKAV